MSSLPPYELITPAGSSAGFTEDPGAVLALLQAVGSTGREPSRTQMAALAAGAPVIRRLSRPRLVRDILDILVSDYPQMALDVMTRAGIMARLLPEVSDLRHMPVTEGRHKDVYRHTLQVVARTQPDPITRLAALLHDIGKPSTKVVERGVVHFPGHAEVGAEMARRRLRELGVERPVREAVQLLVALHLRINSYEAEWTDAAARRLAREAGDQFDRLLDLSRADVTSARREAVERALRRVDALEARIVALREAENQPQSPIDGNELMELFGRPPGRWIGLVKAHLAELVGRGELAPEDRETAATIARAMVAALDG